MVNDLYFTMKTFRFYICLFLLLSACHSKKAQVEKKENYLEEIPSEMLPSTAYQYPDVDIPPSFFLDSLLLEDTLRQAAYNIYFLQAEQPELAAFNQAMRAALKSEISYDRQQLDTCSICPKYPVYWYKQRPTDFYMDDQIISVTTVVDTYTQGGNHHNYHTQTYNFAIDEYRFVTFDKLFRVESATDSLAFIAFAESYVQDGCSWGWGKLDEDLAFAFVEEGIAIYPNLSWACSGTWALLPRDSTNRFLRERWKVK